MTKFNIVKTTIILLIRLWKFRDNANKKKCLTSPGVTGAATERPLEGVAEDPTGVGHIENAHSYLSGRDYKGGVGAEARGRLSPLP